jgi:hypothetical protein
MTRIISGQITCLWLNGGITPVGTMLLKLLPFKALYGYQPPLLALESVLRSQIEDVNSMLRDRQTTLLQLKSNINKA